MTQILGRFTTLCKELFVTISKEHKDQSRSNHNKLLIYCIITALIVSELCSQHEFSFIYRRRKVQEKKRLIVVIELTNNSYSDFRSVRVKRALLRIRSGAILSYSNSNQFIFIVICAK